MVGLTLKLSILRTCYSVGSVVDAALSKNYAKVVNMCVFCVRTLEVLLIWFIVDFGKCI